MKKILKFGGTCLLLAACVLIFGGAAQAKGKETVKQGIYAEHIDLSGMTKEEACLAVESFVAGLRNVPVTLLLGDGISVTATVGEFGVVWANPGLVDEALEVGSRGNVVQRYRVMKDLEHKSLVYPINLSFDLQAISDFLAYRCTGYDRKAVDLSLARVNGVFQVVPGKNGYVLDVETSIDRIHDYLTGGWDYQPCTIAMDVETVPPRGSAEELLQVKDVLGSFTTAYGGSNTERRANIINGCRLIDGVTLYPGDEFSTCEKVAPFTEENGYYPAGSFLDGRVVDSLGGGICQVSTTLYNAVLLAELGVTMRYNHSMTVSYVDISTDAAIAESAGKDFKFVNSLDHPVYIDGRTENGRITFTIYGVEDRPADRGIRYESEVVEVLDPSPDEIVADSAKPVGYISVSGAHTGYRARLWKVVTRDGEEISRTLVNNSSYKMVPVRVTVGAATSNPEVYQELMAAVGTGNAEYVKKVAARLAASSGAGSAE